MRIYNPFRELSKFEWFLWLASIGSISVSFFVSGGTDVLTLIASLIGVTALIFIAKGFVIGQILTVLFAIIYGLISFYFRYYGEMITYLCMTLPISVFTIVSWIRHPYKETNEVEVGRLTQKNMVLLIAGTLFTTTLFYFILDELGTSNLFFSTLSISTSFAASYLSFFRSPYYAIGYAANDLVLIVLWILASLENIAYLPMILCFVMFFFNDLYGFHNWQKIKKRQQNKNQENILKTGCIL